MMFWYFRGKEYKSQEEMVSKLQFTIQQLQEKLKAQEEVGQQTTVHYTAAKYNSQHNSRLLQFTIQQQSTVHN